MTKKEERIEVNKRLIGKSVRIEEDGEIWFGVVESVKDEDTFVIRDGTMLREASIFNVRA
jgi:carbonic anhydrase/acetyltransferase-like protein (isoleucine patch superfamily)